MTIDEAIVELEQLKAWRGGDGSTPVRADGFEILYGKVESGRALLVTNSSDAMETAEKIEEDATERADTMISNAKDDAQDAFNEAMEAIKDLESGFELRDKVMAIFKDLRHKLNMVDIEP